jgi:hypothetical protein
MQPKVLSSGGEQQQYKFKGKSPPALGESGPEYFSVLH